MTRVAAIGDLHVRVGEDGRFRDLFEEIGQVADVLLLAGDLVELGLVEELEVLLADLEACPLPKAAVLGNHDYFSGQVPALTAALTQAGVAVLEGDAVQIGGVGVVGLKGTAGGFNRMLNPIAEPEIVAFAQLSRVDAEKLDTLLSAQETPPQIVLMHYAPIVETIVGEVREEYPFMGSSRYAAVIDQHRPGIVIHGHSHFGTFAGNTPGGVPVRNVAMQVAKPDGRPYALFEV